MCLMVGAEGHDTYEPKSAQFCQVFRFGGMCDHDRAGRNMLGFIGEPADTVHGGGMRHYHPANGIAYRSSTRDREPETVFGLRASS